MHFSYLPLALRIIIFLVVVSVCPSIADGQHSKQLPDTTIAAFSILDFERWKNEFQATGLAAYLNDKQVAGMYRELMEIAKEKIELLSVVNSKRIRDFVSGQATLAILEQNDAWACVVLLDCEDDGAAQKCAELIKTLCRENENELEELDYRGARLYVASTNAGEPTNRRFAFCHNNSQVLFASNLSGLKLCLSPPQKTLRQSVKYKNTVDKSRSGLSEALFWWFADPMAILKKTEKKYYDIAMGEGFEAVKSIGAAGVLTNNDRQFISVGFVAAKQPYQRSMRLLEFDNTTAQNLPWWVIDSTSSGFLNFRIERILPSFSTLFDSIAGDGEDGVFESVLDDLKNNAKGPKLDLQNDIFGQLETPIYFATNSIAGQMQTVTGVLAKNIDQVEEAITKFYNGDPNAVRLKQSNGAAWKVLPLQDGASGPAKPYFVATRDGYLIVAPTLDSISMTFDRKKENSEWHRSENVKNWLNSEASFGYSLNLNLLAATKHFQLKNATVGGWLGALITRSGLQDAIRQADRKRWPEPADASKYFDLKLQISGRSNPSGWKFVIETDSRRSVMSSVPNSTIPSQQTGPPGKN